MGGIDVESSLSVIVTTKAGILSQTMIFPNPYQVFYVCNPNQSISTALQERIRKSCNVKKSFTPLRFFFLQKHS